MGGVCARFAAGMGQLHSGYASLFMNKTDDSTQHLDVLVAPDSEILRTDATFGENSRCLGQDQSGATDRATPEMNEMPVVRESAAARILTHRRDEHPIGKRQISNRERIKQARHGQLSVIVLSCQLPAAPQLVRRRVLFSNPNATYEQSSNSSRAAAAVRLACFLRRLSLEFVGIARATKGDVTPAGEKFCEILRQLTGTLQALCGGPR
jgi:hypothetical protein